MYNCLKYSKSLKKCIQKINPIKKEPNFYLFVKKSSQKTEPVFLIKSESEKFSSSHLINKEPSLKYDIPISTKREPFSYLDHQLIQVITQITILTF